MSTFIFPVSCAPFITTKMINIQINSGDRKPEDIKIIKSYGLTFIAWSQTLLGLKVVCKIQLTKGITGGTWFDPG